MLPSPCINVCKMDADSGLCLGCFRTLDEITVWSRTDDVHRTRILAAVAERRAETAPLAGELRGDKP
ncbi:DUF1289 domain-containing protein [Dechloromonas sp. A34]|uniref:DUF1289 domain-containing protein n=1 Tax=Dechloromonas sp. A34 TaxID=447588 RepID=UPI00224952EE|nr:DUF1289 domain-containing protein [Dechloromonas sp. A34]